MTLADAGALVALVDADDQHHHRCRGIMPRLSLPLIITWPCLTEAMYLLHRRDGLRAQERLWILFEGEAALLHVGLEDERRRARELMGRYSDAPMDLADASVVAAAETLDLRRVFTLDRHFLAYRFRDRHPFEILP